MRHRIHGKKLNRSPAHRLALRRNLARSLFQEFGERGYIITTRQKAKYVRPFVEKLITLAREKTLHNYRRGLKLLRDENMVHRLFEQIGPAYRERPGGYTRILRTSRRRLGDGAVEVLFGFVQDEAVVEVTSDDQAGSESGGGDEGAE